MSSAGGGDAAELSTLLRLLGTADGSVRPLVAVPRAPAGAGPALLARQVLRQVGAAAASAGAGARARRRPAVLRPVRGTLRSSLRDRLRRAAGAGYFAHLPPDAPNLLDIILDIADSSAVSGPQVGADGAVRLLVVRNGTEGLLRVGLAGTPADPSHAAAALEVLAMDCWGLVPRLLASGCHDGVAWTVETRRPGSRPGALSAAIITAVAEFTAGLPSAQDPVPVHVDAAVLAAVAPSAHSVHSVHRIAEAVAAHPLAARPTLRHGDLWLGNLLVEEGRLAGVVDWDAWAPAGLPATDLLHLLATEERVTTRSSLGEVWLRRPWDRPILVDQLRRHWPDWGDDPESRAVLGAAWWLSQLSADLRRNPALGEDARWVTNNITAVTGKHAGFRGSWS